MKKFKTLFRSGRRKSMEDRQNLRIKRIDGLRSLVFSLSIIFLLALAFVMSILIIPPHWELYQLEKQLQTSEELLEESKVRENFAENKLKWMQDPEFIEQIARDRANLAYPDEQIIKFNPEDVEKKSPAPPKESNNDSPEH